MSYKSFYRYIAKSDGKYHIVKDNERWGTYNRLEDALYERDRLMSVDWDWDKSMELAETNNNYYLIELPPFDHQSTHITFDSECWVVRDSGKNQKYRGRYSSEKEAKRVALIYGAKVSHKNSAYRVQRRINGKTVYFGRYKTYKEAERRVKELERNGWKK